jgi:hypothetical protein
VSYQLDVVTACVADAVSRAGGLMFDRRRAGWRVRVLTDDTANARALCVLGTYAESSGQLKVALNKPDRVFRTSVLPLDLFDHAPLGHGPEQHAEIESSEEFLLWGRRVNTELAEPLRPVRHELSAAARIFKAEALRCAGLDTRVESWEEFWVAKVIDVDRFDRRRCDPRRPHDIAATNAGAQRARSPSADMVGGCSRG